jgi:hypothetical protein
MEVPAAPAAGMGPRRACRATLSIVAIHFVCEVIDFVRRMSRN